jgi:hypothetical protein
VLKWKNRESGPEKYRGNKAVISAQNKSSYQVQSTVFPTGKDLVPAPQKPDSLRTLRLARRNMSSFSLSPEHGKRVLVFGVFILSFNKICVSVGLSAER